MKGANRSCADGDLDVQIGFVARACPACGQDSYGVLFQDINRWEGLPVSARLVECRGCGMRYLNPMPDARQLAELYRTGLVDPVRIEPTPALPVSQALPAQLPQKSPIHTINGALRGHPHDWPDEPGKGRSILDFGCHDGSKLTHWHQRGWHVAGVDLDII